MKNRTTFTFTLFFIIAIFTSVTPSFAITTIVPNIPDWIVLNKKTRTIETVSGTHGTFMEFDLSNSQKQKLHVFWIQGLGEKQWKVSSDTNSSDKNITDKKTSFKFLTIQNNPAQLEYDNLLGYSLTIKIEDLGTLTLETRDIHEKDLLKLASKIIFTL